MDNMQKFKNIDCLYILDDLYIYDFKELLNIKYNDIL